MAYLQHDYVCWYELPLRHLFYIYTVMNEVVVLFKIVEKNKMLQFDEDVTENQHAVKVLTQKGICGTVLTVISAEWRTQKLWSCFNFKFNIYTQHISGYRNNFHVTMNT